MDKFLISLRPLQTIPSSYISSCYAFARRSEDLPVHRKCTPRLRRNPYRPDQVLVTRPLFSKNSELGT